MANELSDILGACVDSGSKFDINHNEDEAEVEFTMGPGLFLEGTVPGAVEAHCNPVVLETKGCGIYYPNATSKIVSLDNLLRAKCKVHFEQGLHGDQQYGCTITLLDGTVVAMIYAKGIWRLPTLTRQKAADLHHDRYIATVNCMKEQVLDSNPYKELLGLAAEAEPKRDSSAPVDLSKLEEVDQCIMQLIHNRWGHPLNSTMEQIVRFYKRKGFPP
eukprot:2711476-Rhodomonas_salina.1